MTFFGVFSGFQQKYMVSKVMVMLDRSMLFQDIFGKFVWYDLAKNNGKMSHSKRIFVEVNQ